jgi:hypothetical protein
MLDRREYCRDAALIREHVENLVPENFSAIANAHAAKEQKGAQLLNALGDWGLRDGV